jgi:DNA topoisomerase-1
MRLVIVESASKAKTIEKYLNTGDGAETYEVVASLGHIVDLPKSTVGVNTTTWEPEYILMPDKKERLNAIVSKAKKASRIYLAADPDREGEAIAFHLYRELERRGIAAEKMIRVEFHEITQRAVLGAIENPREIQRSLVEAQEARRVLDRLVGYEASPLLWRRFRGGAGGSGLSAGRVQSATLKLLVERWKAYETHTFVPYWTLDGLFQWDTLEEPLVAKAVKATPLTEKTMGIVGEHIRWNDESDVKNWINTIESCKDWVLKFKSKESQRRPPPPFTTSTLQQEASHRHGFSIESTMKLAQSLYEAGYITYMRTDSTTLAKIAQDAIVNWIKEHHSAKAVQRRNYKTKVANAQEAHEAIRPTDPFFQVGQMVEPKWTDAHRKLYELIWRRTIASQMKDASLFVVSYTITSAAPAPAWELQLSGQQEVLVDLGFLAVLQPTLVADPRRLQQLKEWSQNAHQDHRVNPIQWCFEGNVERPKPLLQEATLVHQMEKKGIGRPSTYAPTLKKIISKGYVVKAPSPSHLKTVMDFQWKPDTDYVSKENVIKMGGISSLVPTSLGERVMDYLKESIGNFVELEFTAKMESQLDEISRGEQSKKAMLQHFYNAFHPTIESALSAQKSIKTNTEPKEKPAKSNQSTPLQTFELPNGKKIEVLQTRYGPALFDGEAKSYISINPFLEWRKKSIDSFNKEDAIFLMGLPITLQLPSTKHPSVEIHLGRYGLYVKEKTINHRLNVAAWDAIYDGTWTPELIQQNIIPTKSKKKKVST